MKKLYILLTLCMLMLGANDGFAQRSRYNKHHSKHRTQRVVSKHKKSKKTKDFMRFSYLCIHESKNTIHYFGCHGTCGMP